MRGVEIRFFLPDATERSLRAKASRAGMKLSPYLRRLLVRIDQTEQATEARSSAKLTERQIADLASRLDAAGLVLDLRAAAAGADLSLPAYLLSLIEDRRVVGTRRNNNSVMQDSVGL